MRNVSLWRARWASRRRSSNRSSTTTTGSHRLAHPRGSAHPRQIAYTIADVRHSDWLRTLGDLVASVLIIAGALRALRAAKETQPLAEEPSYGPT